MKRTFTLLALMAFSVFTRVVYSQVSTTYSFSQVDVGYNGISGGTLLGDDVTDNMDDEMYGPIDIPTFVFDGVAYNKICVSSNGFITFGATLPADAYDMEPISYGEPYNGVVSAFGGDLNYSDLAAGTIRCNTQGTDFVIQWRNVARWVVSDAERISFQIRLDTATNQITVTYGVNIDPGDDQTYPEIGIRGPDSNFPLNVNNREIAPLTGAWVNSTPGTSEFSTCIFDINDPTTVPAVGTQFIWTPIGVDMQAAGLVSPGTQGCYSTNETVSILIRNVSGSTINFVTNPVTVYASASGPNPTTFAPVTINTGTLAVNATQTVMITTNYDMTNFGVYTFDAYTTLTGDSHPTNDGMTPVTRESYTPSIDSLPDLNFCGPDTGTLNGFASAHDYNLMFTNLANDNIPDDNPTGGFTNITVPIVAAGVNASDVSVVVHGISHTWDGDLTIYLRAPDLSTIILSDHNGGAGQNYIETYFSDTATVPIATGTAPFTGSFLPEQPFTNLTGMADGVWRLTVIDDVADDNGTLEGWSILIPVNNSIVTYNWSPATGLSSTTIPNPDASPASTTTYTLTVTDVSGCTNTETVTVTVNPLPTVTANATEDTLCGGASVVLTGGGATSYAWNNGVSDGILFIPVVSDMYVVQGTDANNCTGMDSIMLYVFSNPAVSFSFLPDTFCTTAGLINLSGASPPGGVFTGTGVSGTTFDPGVGIGSYNIIYTYTDVNSCFANDAERMTVISCLGLDDIILENVVIYPNPNDGNFYIDFGESDLNKQVNIYNMLGEIIYNENIQTDLVNISLDVKPGMYIVEITNGYQVVRKQIIISNNH